MTAASMTVHPLPYQHFTFRSAKLSQGISRECSTAAALASSHSKAVVGIERGLPDDAAHLLAESARLWFSDKRTTSHPPAQAPLSLISRNYCIDATYGRNRPK
jgi:hypothetical protein